MAAIEEDAVEPVLADGPGGAAFWIGALLGAGLVVFGIHGLWVNERSGFASAARWFVGGALVLDLIVVPLGALAGWAGKKLVPDWTWPVVRAALFASVVLIVVAAPLVLDQGGVPDNPTVRPRDYGTGLLVALIWTWVIAAIALGVQAVRRRRS
jgi:sterol desaturase/sphingolipid hydroxylase (fatty acid hydroxylase superfamily)